MIYVISFTAKKRNIQFFKNYSIALNVNIFFNEIFHHGFAIIKENAGVFGSDFIIRA